MAQYIDKDALVAEIERRKQVAFGWMETVPSDAVEAEFELCDDILSFINTLEVKDPYEQSVQYDSIKTGIQAHAETYSFNIESKLFNQLTKEQQALWRKEIEQACISGGEMGVELARDTRYKDTLEMKEVDLEEELDEWMKYGPHTSYPWCTIPDAIEITAKHFFELGLAQK